MPAARSATSTDPSPPDRAAGGEETSANHDPSSPAPALRGACPGVTAKGPPIRRQGEAHPLTIPFHRRATRGPDERGGQGEGSQGTMRGVAGVAPAGSPPPGAEGGQKSALHRLGLSEALRERGERAGGPARPNHRYVMRRFLLWRHFCGIGCPACSPGASCLPSPSASLSALSLRLWPALISLCLCLSLQPCLCLLTR